jgi:threonine synthase
VNSINWARVLAQVVYYFFAAFRVMDATGARRVRFAVPTGNFGDIFAGYVAARMGLPVDRLILATNENDILARFFRRCDYSLGSVKATLSPSMDIQVASNFERYLYYRVGEDPERLRKLMEAFAETGKLDFDPLAEPESPVLIEAGSGDTPATLAAIRETWERDGVLLDPHTAVGVSVGRTFLSDDAPMICLATAHPAKFPEAIREATGKDLAHHELIDRLQGLPSRCRTIPNSIDQVKACIEETARAGR